MSRSETAVGVISASPGPGIRCADRLRRACRVATARRMTCRFEHFDARPGGSYRLVLAYADASAAREVRRRLRRGRRHGRSPHRRPITRRHVISLTERDRTESSPGPRGKAPIEGIVGNRAIESAAIQWILALERADGRKQWAHESAAPLMTFQARLGLEVVA
jgi:hypothetical protein